MNHETQTLDKEIADKNILGNIYGISYAIHFSFRETPRSPQNWVWYVFLP